MDKSTLFWNWRWLTLEPRAWLLLGLALSLMLVGAAPPPTGQPDWEVLPAARQGWGWLRPSRAGRWLGRLSGVLQASGPRLVCRLGLMLTLLEGSGLTNRWPAVEHLLWLPLADGALAVVGLMEWSVVCHPVYRAGRALIGGAYRWSVWGLLAVSLHHWLGLSASGLAWGGLLVCQRDASRVELERCVESDGQTTYRVRLVGDFAYEVTPRDEFETRSLILDLRRLRLPGREPRAWGVVTQEALATVFGVTQEEISRWEGYRRDGRWAQLLSLADPCLLTDDLRQQIVEVWAVNLWQTAAQVRQRLAERGRAVARRLVEEAGRQSGLMQIRAQLKAQGVTGPEGWRPRDTYVVEQLFRLVDDLQAQLAQAGCAPRQAEVEIATLRQMAGAPAPEKRLEKAWPCWFQVEHWLFGAWETLEDSPVRCTHCGSEHVAVKSRQPRRKVYLDDAGQRQTVEVYRYYCKNPDCPYQTFTNLPPGVLAHSVWTLDARLKALELYAGLRTTYRGAAAALGVTPATLYHWLARFGATPLPIAALFGLVRSSGVVGIDEKWVKVPKNDKPAGKHRQWMYVYVAVDAHTLDLLHINLFPYLNQDSVHTFLLELRAHGYQPRVIVTDLSPDYPAALAAVFPTAVHHECVFHALQYWHRCFKDTFGRHYADTHPAVFQVRQQIDRIFQARTRRTVEKRYAALMAQRDPLVQAAPDLAPILASLARHYPLLVNAYDRPDIPLTNNATERLIRRFDQHYQNFAGFDSLATARAYLQLFALTYRFTPFGPEVQPHLRGRCPLELAGYDLTHVPLARYLREHGTTPLLPPPPEVVPT